jgi:MinD-like ATPase involved in chromosome partitioning or flagellar assembly
VSAERYVVVCLATARSAWLARLSHWVNAGMLSVDLVRCLTPAEFNAAVQSRAISLALVEEMARHTDRDLLAGIRATGASPVVVTAAGPARRDWLALGADATLTSEFELAELTDLLRTRARPQWQPDAAAPPSGGRAHAGRLVAVCGPGGTGASTVAIALAQGLAQSGSASVRRQVLLADLVPGGQQALLHGGGAVPGGLALLVESHRRRGPAPSDIGELTYDVAARGYSLLTGLAHRRGWTAVRPAALEAALSALLGAFDVVVCDVASDFEGEADGGSIDVEERNAAARSSLARASAVVVVGQPGVKGTHSLIRLFEDVLASGVDGSRVVAVVNRARRGPVGRGEVAAALRLVTPGADPTVVFVPDRPVERAIVDALRLPEWISSPLAEVIAPYLSRPGEPEAPSPVPLSVTVSAPA